MPGNKAEGSLQFIGWDLLSDRLRRIDGILNSKREDLVKRLREGNHAWEQRKKQHLPGPTDAENQPPYFAIDLDDDIRERKRRFRRIRRDNEYPSIADNTFPQRSPESARENKVRTWHQVRHFLHC